MPPGTITALALQAGDQERVNVFVDGDFAIGVSIYVVQDLRLRKGQILSQQDWDRLVEAERGTQAWNAALRLLEQRARSEREIRDRLRRKEFNDQQIETTLARLRELGLVDDEQFARQWVANRQNFRPRGAQALRQELQSKGVNREIASEIIGEMTDADKERDACREVAQQAFRKYADSPDRQTFLRKFGGFLQRRGFSFETIKPILDELWNERQRT